MHINAANSLLKFIEEPQSQIYIFLLTADDSRMLPTIKSRAQLFYFPKNRAYLEELLQKEGLLLTQAKVLADFAKDDVQALDLAKDNKILDLINTVERFTQSCYLIRTCFIWTLQNWLSSVVKSRNKRWSGLF